MPTTNIGKLTALNLTSSGGQITGAIAVYTMIDSNGVSYSNSVNIPLTVGLQAQLTGVITGFLAALGGQTGLTIILN